MSSRAIRRKSNRKRKSSRRLFRIVFLVGLLLVLALIFFVSGSTHKLVLEIMGSLQNLSASTSSMIGRFTGETADLLDDKLRLQEENKRLHSQLKEKEKELNQSREEMATNASLRKLLDFKESIDHPVIAARIIGKDPSPWFRSVIIDRGANSGVAKGNPVVSGDGVIGQVFAVSPNYAKVLLAIAPSSAIDVLLQHSRMRGILKGDGTMVYRLEYILKTTEVKENDIVVTAGYGGAFPTGLPVGRVSRIIHNPRGMFHEIEVAPSVDYQTLEYLLVIPQPDREELRILSSP